MLCGALEAQEASSRRPRGDRKGKKGDHSASDRSILIAETLMIMPVKFFLFGLLFVFALVLLALISALYLGYTLIKPESPAKLFSSASEPMLAAFVGGIPSYATTLDATGKDKRGLQPAFFYSGLNLSNLKDRTLRPARQDTGLQNLYIVKNVVAPSNFDQIQIARDGLVYPKLFPVRWPSGPFVSIRAKDNARHDIDVSTLRIVVTTTAGINLSSEIGANNTIRLSGLPKDTPFVVSIKGKEDTSRQLVVKLFARFWGAQPGLVEDVINGIPVGEPAIITFRRLFPSLDSQKMSSWDFKSQKWKLTKNALYDPTSTNHEILEAWAAFENCRCRSNDDDEELQSAFKEIVNKHY